MRHRWNTDSRCCQSAQRSGRSSTFPCRACSRTVSSGARLNTWPIASGPSSTTPCPNSAPPTSIAPARASACTPTTRTSAPSWSLCRWAPHGACSSAPAPCAPMSATACPPTEVAVLLRRGLVHQAVETCPVEHAQAGSRPPSQAVISGRRRCSDGTYSTLGSRGASRYWCWWARNGDGGDRPAGRLMAAAMVEAG